MVRVEWFRNCGDPYPVLRILYWRYVYIGQWSSVGGISSFLLSVAVLSLSFAML